MQGANPLHPRRGYPALQLREFVWRFERATPAYGKWVYGFANAPNSGLDEFSAEEVEFEGGGYQTRVDLREAVGIPRRPIESILTPMAGGLVGGSPNAIAPLDGVFPSEFSLQFLVLFLLSSVVRYRPDTWTHAINRSVLGDRPSDDELIALVERFLELHTSSIVDLVSKGLNPHDDR